MRRSETFQPDAASVRAARRFAVEALQGLSPEVLEPIELMVSELATNSVRHGHTAFELTIAQSGGQVRVEVRDRATGRPTMRTPRPDEPTGRGLQIVDLLSDSWGVEQGSGPGKTVWLILSTPSGGDGARLAG